MESKNYPNNFIWEYSTFLGTFEDKNGQKWDLGICVRTENTNECNYSFACAYSNTDYISGEYIDFKDSPRDVIQETIKRAKLKKLID